MSNAEAERVRRERRRTQLREASRRYRERQLADPEKRDRYLERQRENQRTVRGKLRSLAEANPGNARVVRRRKMSRQATRRYRARLKAEQVVAEALQAFRADPIYVCKIVEDIKYVRDPELRYVHAREFWDQGMPTREISERVRLSRDQILDRSREWSPRPPGRPRQTTLYGVPESFTQEPR